MVHPFRFGYQVLGRQNAGVSYGALFGPDWTTSPNGNNALLNSLMPRVPPDADLERVGITREM